MTEFLANVFSWLPVGKRYVLLAFVLGFAVGAIALPAMRLLCRGSVLFIEVLFRIRKDRHLLDLRRFFHGE